MSNKTPILGKAAKAEEAKTFRVQKLALKERGYPLQETKALVKEIFDQVAHKFEGKINHNTALVKVPSGSGENKITVLFANMLAEKFGASVVPDGLIMRKHRLEAKLNLSLEKRISDPIGYGLYVNELKGFTGNKSVVVVDDLIGSGESSVKLKKTLESQGVKVEALVNLVTVESRYPTVTDLGRVVEKVTKHKTLTVGEKENFWKDLDLVFGDYTRQKLNRLERGIVNEYSAIGAYNVVKKAATIEREFIKDLAESKGKTKNIQLSI